jgi:exosortase/archaeosortase family protein
VIDKPLTDWSTKGAEKILKVFYPQGKFMIKESCTIAPEFNNAILCSDVLILDKKKIIGVADICNGLELYVLYIGFLCAFPSSVIKKIVFILLGVFIIYFANVFRLVGLATMNLKQSNSIEMAHHYLFKMIVYTLIFVMWVLFARSQNKT